jgi:predicted ATPase/antitoxin (DNA-binding transcriptional repressor) of toxin-antitoxin stability system
MLTRLKVNGFKNLVEVDVRFGPFTCIAGANGVGKSNLFDAIRFLSALADEPLIEAAKSVREGRTADVHNLFHRVGVHYDDRMSFEAEMIVPAEGEDDLGQKAKARITFLRYTLELVRRRDDSHLSLGGLEIEKEELVHINLTDATKHLLFPHKPVWRQSALKGRRTAAFLSTELESGTEGGPQRVIKVHQDGGGGMPASRRAANLPRTVLSASNAAENQTVLLARREMQSWRLLQLEPSALRESDEFTAPTRLGTNGSHLAATLYRLARASRSAESDEAWIYAQVADRLSDLIQDVREVGIDRDERRELLTLQVRGRDGTAHPARALSDGTLRFLALAVIELDPAAQGVLCLEEPENGIHPERIPAMLRLLQDIATDTDEAIGPNNPLRQVIINTHSPAVVSEVPDDSLIVAELKETVRPDDESIKTLPRNQRFQRVRFGCLEGTWRQKNVEDGEEVNVVAKGKLLAYLNPISGPEHELDRNGHEMSGSKPSTKTRRVVDRPDLQPLLPFGRET